MKKGDIQCDGFYNEGVYFKIQGEGEEREEKEEAGKEGSSTELHHCRKVFSSVSLPSPRPPRLGVL